MSEPRCWERHALKTRLTPTLEVGAATVNYTVHISSPHRMLAVDDTLESGNLQGLLARLSTFSGVKADRK